MNAFSYKEVRSQKWQIKTKCEQEEWTFYIYRRRNKYGIVIPDTVVPKSVPDISISIVFELIRCSILSNLLLLNFFLQQSNHRPTMIEDDPKTEEEKISSGNFVKSSLLFLYLISTISYLILLFLLSYLRDSASISSSIPPGLHQPNCFQQLVFSSKSNVPKMKDHAIHLSVCGSENFLIYNVSYKCIPHFIF